MKTIELLKKLEGKPVFKVQDIERICNCKREYAKLILYRLRKRGLIKRVTRNVYTLKESIWVIASNITYPSYISFWSASYFYGYTEQIVNTIQLATYKKRGPILFENYLIKFIPIKYLFGFRKLRTENGSLFIAEPEKLLIDAFLKPEECGNFSEILKIYKNSKISEEKVVRYLKMIKKESVVRRVGYLLEKIKGIDISKHFSFGKNYLLLNPFSKSWKKIDAKWRVKI